MHASLRKYTFDPKNAAVIKKKVNEVFVPLIKKSKGFVSYYYIETGAGSGISMSVFKDQGGTEESVRIAAEFVRKELPNMISKPEVLAGEIAAQG